MNKTAYYFGVWPGDGAGHFLHDESGRRIHNQPEGGFPCTLTPDGVFLDKSLPLYCPQVWHTEGWTVYAMWDSSEDKRPGCSSTFFFRGHGTPVECWDLVVLKFPKIAKRISDARMSHRGDQRDQAPKP